MKFGTRKHTTSRPFEYAHSDVWGPSKTTTHWGGRYFMTIVDDYSKRLWTYVLKSKDEASSKFKEWVSLIENQLDKTLKHQRTDNGLEFCSDQFNDFCKQKVLLGTEPHQEPHSKMDWQNA